MNYCWMDNQISFVLPARPLNRTKLVWQRECLKIRTSHLNMPEAFASDLRNAISVLIGTVSPSLI